MRSGLSGRPPSRMSSDLLSLHYDGQLRSLQTWEPSLPPAWSALVRYRTGNLRPKLREEGFFRVSRSSARAVIGAPSHACHRRAVDRARRRCLTDLEFAQ